MNNIFDGIQRPLQSIFDLSKSIYIPKGINTPALDKDKQWHFEPQKLKVPFIICCAKEKVGDHITGGDIFGKVVENMLITHWILLPPGEMGTITYIAPAANYTLKVTTLERKL